MGARFPIDCAALAWLAACSAAPAPIDDPVAPPASIDVAPEPPTTPATGWRYHPRAMAEILDGTELPDGRWLLIGERGERWVTSGGPSPTRLDDRAATAAAHRAGEPLEHVVPWRAPGHPSSSSAEGARWLFIGESGRSYFAHEPLGPMTPGPRAPRAIADVAPTASGALAVDLVGGTLRFDGAAWEPTPSKPDGTSDHPRLFGVARRGGGGLVGLALPERLWGSDDGGASWTPLATGPLGTQRLSTSRRGDVVLDGAAGTWLLASDGSTTPAATPLVDPRQLAPEAARGPSAPAIAEDTAALTPEGYVEIVEREVTPDADGDEERRAEWLIRRGALGGRLEERPIGLRRSCDGLVVAAAGRHLWIGCGEAAGETMRVRLLHSPDRGAHLREVAVVVSALPERVSMACDGEGVALVSAVCPSHRPACRLGAPLRVRTDGRLEPTVAPELVGPSFEPVAGANGRTYFLGERAKDGRVALFVSQDTERYRAQPLEPPKGYRGPWDRELTTPRSLHPAADGTVGIVTYGTAPLYAVADRQGRVTHVASLPENTIAVGGHGRQVLALTKAPDGLAIEAHESGDAGLSFRPLVMPMGLGADELDDSPRVACGALGCVIDTRVTRLGWSVHGPSTPALSAPQLPPPEPRPATRTPITCGVTSPATRLIHVEGATAMPTIDEVMRGDVAWSVLRHVRGTGEVEVVAMSFANGAKRQARHRLLAASQPRANWAVDVAAHHEGYAALRTRLPKGGRDAIAGAPMRVEVAWLDTTDVTVRRGVIPDAGALTTADVTPGATPSLVTGLVALTPPGIALRPSDRRRDTWLLDEKGAIVGSHAFPELPPTRSTRATVDALRLGDAVFATETHHLDGPPEASTLATAPMGGGAAVLTAVAPPALGRTVDTSVAYRAGAPGLVTMLVAPRHDVAYGYFAPLLDSGHLGQAHSLPTQATLNDPPKGCSASERREGIRIVAPHQTGTRHPVLIQDGSASVAMLTDGAVLYGTADAPCLAGWIARSIGRGPELVALVAGDLSHAWLFEDSEGPRTLTHRPMRCQLTPDAEVPAEVWKQEGTIAVEP